MKDDNKQKGMDKMPKDWDSIKLGESNRIELIMGQSPPSSSYNEKRKGLPFLQGSADFGARYPYINKYTSQPMKIAEKNDVLISVRAPVGDVNIAPVKLCIGRGLAAIRVNEGNNLFYFYWIQKVKNKLAAIGTGSTFKAVTKNELYNFEIPILPLKEEQKIAEILSAVDEGIQKVDEVIKKTERLKKGLMQNLLTKGIGHKEFKETKLGKIPKNWQIRQIGEIAIEIYRYPTYYNIEYQKKGIPEIRGELIKENGSLENDLSKYRHISPKLSNRFSKTVLEEGDFVISVRGTMGKVAMVSRSLKGANITANLMKISFNRNECYPAFLKQIFLSKSFKNKLNNLSSNTTIKTIQVPILKSIKIKLPPISEQQKISEILSTVDKKIELQRKRKEKLERIKKSLMNDLLSGKRRVRIN